MNNEIGFLWIEDNIYAEWMLEVVKRLCKGEGIELVKCGLRRRKIKRLDK